MVRLADLEAFVVAAKSATYVGSGSPAESSRPGSHDLMFEGDDWLYRDSYFGGTNFLGQETVWLRGEPVWRGRTPSQSERSLKTEQRMYLRGFVLV